MTKLILATSTILLQIAAGNTAAGSESRSAPNIVLVLADDMGYGDPGCYNPRSKIPTPAIDRLADEGMRFTDAHAPGSVCVPSRYGLLTGRYPFRGNLNWQRRAVIDADRPTIASMLAEQGYATAMIGKWHQGFEGGPDYDWSKPLAGGPVDRGFQSFFGIPASTDIPPYYYIRGDRPDEPPTQRIEANNTEGWTKIQGAFWREGLIASDMKLEDVLPRLTREAVDAIHKHAKKEKNSLFLYVALPAPHTPWLPLEKFRGKSGAGTYGDFVMQVDDTLGQILAALDETGVADNTVVIFTSDNGPVWYDQDVERFGHDSAGPLRGMKGDAWEAGHRVPFIARWPGVVPAKSVTDQTISFVDLMATFAAVAGTKLPPHAGEDSVDLLPILRGEATSRLREYTVFKQQATSIRHGKWKLITHLGSGGFSQPRREKPKPGGPRGQLYDLYADLGETNNLWQNHPEIVERLTAELRRIKQSN